MAKAKKRYFATREIVVDGIPRQGGDDITEAAEGCLKSMLRLGQATDVPPKQWGDVPPLDEDEVLPEKSAEK